MRNFKKYRTTVLNLFADFLAGKINKTELLFALGDIELEMQGKKELWFKFSDDDTLTTTIQDLNIDIYSRVNGEYIRERMQFAIDNPKQFKIHYS